MWQSQDILTVPNTNCGVGATLHHRTEPSISNIRVYDIGGRNAKSLELLNQFNVDTREFFLWEDPEDRDRALVFAYVMPSPGTLASAASAIRRW